MVKGYRLVPVTERYRIPFRQFCVGPLVDHKLCAWLYQIFRIALHKAWRKDGAEILCRTAEGKRNAWLSMSRIIKIEIHAIDIATSESYLVIFAAAAGFENNCVHK